MAGAASSSLLRGAVVTIVPLSQTPLMAAARWLSRGCDGCVGSHVPTIYLPSLRPTPPVGPLARPTPPHPLNGIVLCPMCGLYVLMCGLCGAANRQVLRLLSYGADMSCGLDFKHLSWR